MERDRYAEGEMSPTFRASNSDEQLSAQNLRRDEDVDHTSWVINGIIKTFRGNGPGKWGEDLELHDITTPNSKTNIITMTGYSRFGHKSLDNYLEKNGYGFRSYGYTDKQGVRHTQICRSFGFSKWDRINKTHLMIALALGVLVVASTFVLMNTDQSAVRRSEAGVVKRSIAYVLYVGRGAWSFVSDFGSSIDKEVKNMESEAKVEPGEEPPDEPDETEDTAQTEAEQAQYLFASEDVESDDVNDDASADNEKGDDSGKVDL